MKKYQSFLSKNFQFLEVKFSIYLNRHVFVMANWPAMCTERLIRRNSRRAFFLPSRLKFCAGPMLSRMRVRLVIGMSWVRSSPGTATLFHGD